MRGLAYRRHQSRRRKAHARRLLQIEGLEPTPRAIGIRAAAPRMCSCDWCSRDRRVSLPAQERRELERAAIESVR